MLRNTYIMMGALALSAFAQALHFEGEASICVRSPSSTQISDCFQSGQQVLPGLPRHYVPVIFKEEKFEYLLGFVEEGNDTGIAQRVAIAMLDETMRPIIRDYAAHNIKSGDLLAAVVIKLAAMHPELHEMLQAITFTEGKLHKRRMLPENTLIKTANDHDLNLDNPKHLELLLQLAEVKRPSFVAHCVEMRHRPGTREELVSLLS